MHINHSKCSVNREGKCMLHPMWVRNWKRTCEGVSWRWKAQFLSNFDDALRSSTLIPLDAVIDARKDVSACGKLMFRLW